MNTENVQNVGAASEAAVVSKNSEISFAEKMQAMACTTWSSVKEFAHEVWTDEEGRKLLKDIGIALCVRLAFRHPLTAGIAVGVVGHQVWQEIKATKKALNN